MKIQSSFNAWVLPLKASIIAGPIDLAGFTEVPVNAKPSKWTKPSERPMIIPVILLFSGFDKTPSTANIKTNVKIISTSTPSKYGQSILPLLPLYFIK